MSMLLVSVTLALGVGTPPAAKGPSLDGKWLIVYAEEGGRRNNAWEQRPATVKGTTLSYEAEGGKMRSMKLKLGKNQTLTATVSGGDAMEKRSGVYILGQDYLCLSLGKAAAKKDNAGAGAAAPEAAAPAGAAAAAQQSSSGDFILILRRQRGKAPTP